MACSATRSRLAENMEGIRTIWRLRDRHVKEAGRAVQHMQKALTKMNIQLANVISDISGVSGQAIIAAILNGERDCYKLADLKHERVQASREEVARSLEGNWRADVLFELQQAVNSYEFAHRQMQECDAKLEAYLTMLPTRVIPGRRPTRLATGGARRQGQKTEKAQEASRQRTGTGSGRGTETDFWSGSDVDRRNRCDGSANDPLRAWHGSVCISDGEPFCLVVGADTEQRHQRR